MDGGSIPPISTIGRYRTLLVVASIAQVTPPVWDDFARARETTRAEQVATPDVAVLLEQVGHPLGERPRDGQRIADRRIVVEVP